jgi:hypothetical protein
MMGRMLLSLAVAIGVLWLYAWAAAPMLEHAVDRAIDQMGVSILLIGILVVPGAAFWLTLHLTDKLGGRRGD